MSLAYIAPRARGLMRLHGWLLVAWAMVVGLVTSTLMLHVLNVHSLALRYGVGAAAIYFVGFLGGGWFYARWWNRQRGYLALVPQHAPQQDVLDYQQHEEEIGKKFRGLDWLDLGFGGDDPLSALLAVVGLVVALFFLLLLLGYMPYLATEAFAGFLAEVVLEFVIGAVIARRVLKPRDIGAYWYVMLRKTWPVGIVMVVLCAAVGWVVQSVHPDALTLFQIF